MLSAYKIEMIGMIDVPDGVSLLIWWSFLCSLSRAVPSRFTWKTFFYLFIFNSQKKEREKLLL